MALGHIIFYPKVMRYYLKAAKILWQLNRFIHKQHKNNPPPLSPIQQNYNFFSKYYNRTRQYMFANFFFGEWLNTLRAQVISPKEKERFVWLSSCAPIFDDFFEKNADLTRILQLLQTPKTELAQTKEEKVAVFFFQKILKSLPQQQSIINTASQLFEAQKLSQSQKLLNTSDVHKAFEISIQKGGYSGKMYAELFDEDEKQSSRLHLAYLLGAYGQLMDDVYDLYDDKAEGINSFVNLCTSTDKIITLIDKHKVNILDYAYIHFGNEKGYTDFCHVMCIFSAMIRLPILHYKTIEKTKSITLNNCLSLDRKYWITDMEKPINILRLFNLSAQEMYALKKGFVR